MVSLALLKEQLLDSCPERSYRLDVHQEIENLLTDKFRLTQFFYAHKEQFFPITCLSYGAADWAVKTASAFLSNFYDRLGISHQYDEARKLEGEELSQLLS